jgi:hypothetical protein
VKYKLLIFSSFLFLCACDQCSLPLIDSQKRFKLRDTSSTRNMSKIEFEEHTYIILWANYHVEGQSFLHDPDCKCKLMVEK